MGVADVALQSKQKTPLPQKANIAVASPSVEAVTVNVTMPETVKETYLEVRDIATDEGNYDLVIDYTQEPVPPLSQENTAWVDEVLKEKGLR